MIHIPSKSPRNQVFRSWTGGKAPKSSTSKSLNDEINKFKTLVAEYQEENDRLRSTLSAFACTDDPSACEYLIEQFDNELKHLSQRIDKRSSTLASVNKKVTRTKAAIVKDVDNRDKKTNLISENQQLIARALYLEKQMISAKLQLRLNHDHRDFCRLKRQLARLVDHDENAIDEEDEINDNRQRIATLKRAIEHEKNRLVRYTVPPTLEEEAAETIQRCWRGYMSRKLNPKPPRAPEADDSPFPELTENSDAEPISSNQATMRDEPQLLGEEEDNTEILV